MSAYVVSNKTISVIAEAFVMYNVDYSADDYKRPIQIIINRQELYETIGQSLLNQNYTSVNFRYRENSPTPKFTYEEVNLVNNGKVDTGLIYGCIECYEYQACETDDWDKSDIYYSLMRLKAKMLERYIEKDGFEISWGC